MTTTNTATRIPGSTHADYLAAVQYVSRRRVVECPNIGDAASPVSLHAGQYVTGRGNAGAQRHDIASLAESLDAALVESYYDGAGWCVRVDGADMGDVEQHVRALVRARQSRDIAARRAAQEQRIAEESAATAAERKETLARVLAVAEQWAPGRVAVRMVWVGGIQGQHRVQVGRWDAPLTPGYGTPAQVVLAAERDGRIVLVSSPDCTPAQW